MKTGMPRLCGVTVVALLLGCGSTAAPECFCEAPPALPTTVITTDDAMYLSATRARLRGYFSAEYTQYEVGFEGTAADGRHWSLVAYVSETMFVRDASTPRSRPEGSKPASPASS